MKISDVRYLIAKECHTSLDGIPKNSVCYVECQDGSHYEISCVTPLEKRYHDRVLDRTDYLISYYDRKGTFISSQKVETFFRLAQVKMFTNASYKNIIAMRIAKECK